MLNLNTAAREQLLIDFLMFRRDIGLGSASFLATVTESSLCVLLVDTAGRMVSFPEPNLSSVRIDW